MRTLIILLLVVAAPLLSGCAKYQFSIVEPPDLAGAIERKGQRAVNRPPLEYTLFDVRSNAIGVRIGNTTEEPIKLIGESSYVVDPDGKTHQMAGGTIAPRSYIDFALPPSMHVHDPGPRFTIGVGTGFYGDGYYGGFGSYWGPPYYRDYVVRAWTWRTGDVRLHTEFELDGERFAHEFVFRREQID